jgi:hypothetical protein
MEETTGKSNSSKRRRRLAWLTLLTCQQHQQHQTMMMVAEASTPLLQHHVSSSHRKVPYQHMLLGQSRNGNYARVHHSHTYINTNPAVQYPLQKEFHTSNLNDDEDHLWVLHVSATTTTTTTTAATTTTTTTANPHHSPTIRKTNPRNLGGEVQQQQQQQQSDSWWWRRLFDQFVGAELLPGSGNINSTNVTTEVEFESSLDTTTTTTGTSSNGNNNNDPSQATNEQDDHDDPSTSGSNSSFISSSSNITTMTTGNATEAGGNITESVIYTKPADDVENMISGNNSNSSSNSNNNNNNNNSSSSSSNSSDTTTLTEFQPLRIRAILAENSGKGNLLNETERNALFHDMLSPALLAWSSSLRVDPVVGNLTVDVNQLLDGQTCGPGIDSGLPSIQVPLHHIEQGIPETDMIVYLSLGFAIQSSEDDNDDDDDNDNSEKEEEDPWFDNTFTGNSSNTDTEIQEEKEEEEEEVDDEEVVMNDIGSKRHDGMGGWIKEMLIRGGEARKKRQLSSNKNNNNNNNTNSNQSNSTMGGRTGPLSEGTKDFQRYTNDTNTTELINICTGDYLAAASYCSSDQYDRPTAALLHICIDDTFFDPKYLQRNILTIMHELGHALGFNSLSMAHFRKPDGTPYTRRDKDGNVPQRTVECTGAETVHQTATIALPSPEILKFREVRGGVRVAEIVTPSVVQVVRNQFGCQLLTGAELESGEGLPLGLTGHEGCIGDHWERRLFSSDLMNPVVDDLEYSLRISTLTLAYFADSGWYQVDLSNADVASGWGRGAGCNFVNDACINDNGEVPPQNAPFFCNEVSNPGISLSQDIHGCTPDLSRKATCSIGQYNLDLPPAYQYFNSTYGADVGGSDTLMDFCVSLILISFL